MNNLHIEFGEISIIINVIVRVLTAIIASAFLIPLLIKEAKVKNGLRTLRYEMLIAGVIIFLINTVGLAVIVARFFGANIQLLADIITYFNSFGFLVLVIIYWRIYTKRYTPENKELHAKFEKMEQKQFEKTQKKEDAKKEERKKIVWEKNKK